MKVIRGEGPLGDIETMALCIEWGVRRCNQKGCRNKPNTIISGASKAVPLFGLCEEHYQQGNVPGGTSLSLEFDAFDAFDAFAQKS